MELKKQILKICMQKGFLLDKEILESLSLLDERYSLQIIDVLTNLKIKERVITKSIFLANLANIKKVVINKESGAFFEKFFSSIGCPLDETVLEVSLSSKKIELPGTDLHSFKILSSSLIFPKKIEVRDFVDHFRSRYEQLRNVLQERNLENLKSIRRLGEGNDKESQYIIVSILSKRQTKNKNLVFDVEDLTGRARVLVNENKKELYEKCKDILVDEVVAFSVSGTKEMLFTNEVTFPDSVLSEKRKHSEEVLVAFSSDVHVGSKMFLEENFLKFIKWLNGEEGDEVQREIAKKVKYLFLVGDNVDGVGVFPEQDKLLKIPEITAQYKKLAEFLKLIRSDIRIIISPGQHDAVWVGEPQPAIGDEWASDICKMSNVSLVTNPCLVEIDGGFKVLMYHGASMHGIIEEMPDLRLNYGHKSPTRVVKELLKRRHLAPMHGSCDYVPNNKKDPMVIDTVPDIMVTGDLHRQEISTYNNILLISSSCWQSITPFEEKVGNVPDPGKVPIFNLKTREIKILDFITPVETTSELKKGEVTSKEVPLELTK
ncbi:metallophosphoesterase [Candidatus Pacearchaeota archaeon]|nr:metallophosphoesterase [Candidatus Pacearchaeota archaeon]